MSEVANVYAVINVDGDNQKRVLSVYEKVREAEKERARQAADDPRGNYLVTKMSYCEAMRLIISEYTRISSALDDVIDEVDALAPIDIS
jgi:hypothetical protein